MATRLREKAEEAGSANAQVSDAILVCFIDWPSFGFYLWTIFFFHIRGKQRHVQMLEYHTIPFEGYNLEIGSAVGLSCELETTLYQVEISRTVDRVRTGSFGGARSHVQYRFFFIIAIEYSEPCIGTSSSTSTVRVLLKRSEVIVHCWIARTEPCWFWS